MRQYWQLKRIVCAAVAALCACALSRGAVVERKSIEELGRRYGFPRASKVGKKFELESRYSTLSFELDSRIFYFNGIQIWLNGAVSSERGRWTIAAEDAARVIDPLLRPEHALAGAGFSTVVLDPGHGGDDAGAIGQRMVYEKKVVLDVAERVKTKLQNQGLRVFLTREADVPMSLAARSAKARQWRADLFVSIHCNAARDSRAEGIETYIMPCAGFSSTAGTMNRKSFAGNACDLPNMVLAYLVQKELLDKTGAVDRGIKRARFDVLRDACCPAVLVECGFVSNKGEEEKMLSPKYREQVAAAIAAGIQEYLKRAKAAADSTSAKQKQSPR